jgi:hypothetical protein
MAGEGDKDSTAKKKGLIPAKSSWSHTDAHEFSTFINMGKASGNYSASCNFFPSKRFYQFHVFQISTWSQIVQRLSPLTEHHIEEMKDSAEAILLKRRLSGEMIPVDANDKWDHR